MIITSFYILYQNFEECSELRIRKDSDAGVNFSAKKKEVPPSRWATKKPGESMTPGPSMRRPRDPWSLRVSHEATSSLPTQERSLASQIAGRRDEPPGLSLSPGAEHSSKAEIAPQQLPKALCHFDSPPFSYNTYLFDWFGSIIPQPHWVVKSFFRLFWWELGFCEIERKTTPHRPNVVRGSSFIDYGVLISL